MIPPDARADVGAFAYRLSRLDPLAVVRLRPAGPGLVQLWGMLPFKVLASRTIAAHLDGDVTLAAADLLARLDDPELPPPVRRDSAWMWPLPPMNVPAVEGLPVDEVVGLARAAEETLRTASAEGVGDRPVGERVLRDALLDHVAVVVTAEGGRSVEIPQRLVQGLVRMNFHGSGRDGLVTVRASGSWKDSPASTVPRGWRQHPRSG
ncbi:hypothetical protein ACFQX7_13315 [Luedemannella flava]